MAVADWIEHALFKLYVTLNKDHLFTSVHRCTEDLTHFIPNVFMHRRTLLRNQIDFCNAPRKARLYGTIKYMKLIMSQPQVRLILSVKPYKYNVPSAPENAPLFK